MRLAHKFVTSIPRTIEDGVIYISMEYATAIHKCCCGCGNAVVTPFSPTDWKLAFDGETISLYPSLGNWNLKCRSHYWIKNNVVEWAETWNKEQTDAARKNEKRDKKQYFSGKRRSLFGRWFKP